MKKLIVFIILISVVHLSIAGKIIDRFEEANFFIKAGEYDKAIREYEEVLKIGIWMHYF